jgi:hypothetical protein
MKVYINKYKNHWISPYTIIEWLFFWTEWSKCARSKDFIPNDQWISSPAWVDKAADKIEPLSRTIKWVSEKVNRKIDYVKIDRWDTWSMDSTLALIILPMLKQVKETKHGVPAEFVHNWDSSRKDNDLEDAEKKWNEVLDKMIFSFESFHNDWEDQFHSGEYDNTKNPGQSGWLGTHNYDLEGAREYEKRIQEGLELFGKHYRNLWD